MTGIPRPVVKWRRNRVTVEEGVHVELEGQGSPGYQIKSTLTLPALKRSDWPMTLSCSATNSDRGRPLQHQFDVDMERELISKPKNPFHNPSENPVTRHF